MTQTEKYNGWTNYETWNVALWIDNEQGSCSYWRGVAQECWDEADAPSANARLTGREPFTREEKAVIALSRRLKDEMEEANPLASDASMWSDLLGAALSEVNWTEIAENWLENVDKDEPEEEESEDDAEEDE